MVVRNVSTPFIFALKPLTPHPHNLHTQPKTYHFAHSHSSRINGISRITRTAGLTRTTRVTQSLTAFGQSTPLMPFTQLLTASAPLTSHCAHHSLDCTRHSTIKHSHCSHHSTQAHHSLHAFHSHHTPILPCVPAHFMHTAHFVRHTHSLHEHHCLHTPRSLHSHHSCHSCQKVLLPCVYFLELKFVMTISMRPFIFCECGTRSRVRFNQLADLFN